MPVQQNRTGQFLTILKIEVRKLKKAADWFEGSYSETESESEAALVVPVQQNRTGQLPTTSKIKFLQVKKAADWLESSYSETESE